MQLSWADYLVIGGYLAAITAFGSWFARYQKTTRDYFLTGRTVPWWAICFTIVATETSTLTFIGIPAQAYGGNMTFLQLAMGYIIGRVLVSVLFIPAYFRGDLFTSYELLQRRFGERKDGAVVLRAGVVLRHRAAGGPELRGLVSRQVRTDHLPRGALVRGAKDAVRAVALLARRSVGGCVGAVGLVTVLHPLEDVAMHVMEAECVRGE